MKVFIVGDHKTGTGPANVTKEYIRCFGDEALYQKMTGKIARVPELLFKTIICDCILFSGYSAQNVLCIKFAKIFGKKTAYLVHGAITHENKINDNVNEHMSEIEEETLMKSDLLLGVSAKFANWLKDQYPQYKNKIDYVTNGVDFDYLRTLAGVSDKRGTIESSKVNNQSLEIIRDNKKILSIGGGMPRKKIIHICEAIDRYNNCHPTDERITISVIGAEGKDTNAIKAYPFVDYLGMVSAEKKEELYRSSGIFIQNSCFETFGLAVFEALMSGCSILTSNIAGALDLLPDARDTDIIFDYSDSAEIAEKIEILINEPNCERLKAQIDEKRTSWEARTQELREKLTVLINS